MKYVSKLEALKQAKAYYQRESQVSNFYVLFTVVGYHSCGGIVASPSTTCHLISDFIRISLTPIALTP